MESMIKEKGVTFKELEQKIFRYHCHQACEDTKQILEEYDRYLMETRDKALYRNKGKRQSTVKTVYGDVSYRRTVYEAVGEDGIKRFVYLLDEMLELENVGLISEHFAGLLVAGITTKSYRDCAREVSEATGQRISAMGVWNVIQSLGEKVCEEERLLCNQHRKGNVRGKRTAPVLFEETDGVNIRLQGKDRAASSNGKAEMKVAIAYDGWRQTGKERYLLDGKVAFAGFAGSREFHRIREAKIASEYDLDETEVRLLNGDGAQWIRKVPDKGTYFQLDQFHRNRAVQENIPYEKARHDIFGFLRQGDLPGMFRYLSLYRDSLDDATEIENADRLISYFTSNAEGLLPYRMREIGIPESPEGLVYRDMGTMENHIWSIVASRMKSHHRTWSRRGANHLAKILAKKCEGRLYEVTEPLKRALFEEEKLEELFKGMTAAQTARKAGKGYEYPVRGSIPYLSADLAGDGRWIFGLAGY